MNICLFLFAFKPTLFIKQFKNRHNWPKCCTEKYRNAFKTQKLHRRHGKDDKSTSWKRDRDVINAWITVSKSCFKLCQRAQVYRGGPAGKHRTKKHNLCLFIIKMKKVKSHPGSYFFKTLTVAVCSRSPLVSGSNKPDCLQHKNEKHIHASLSLSFLASNGCFISCFIQPRLRLSLRPPGF